MPYLAIDLQRVSFGTTSCSGEIENEKSSKSICEREILFMLKVGFMGAEKMKKGGFPLTGNLLNRIRHKTVYASNASGLIRLVNH